MLAVFCTYGLGLIPQAVKRTNYGYVYMDVAIVLFWLLSILQNRLKLEVILPYSKQAVALHPG